ncbi:hypothetical protein OX284_003415 [Flavobacterium sp. SUN046]|uniref:hypothetical protein n=1 Tax=Flavobacterium sp. SUN046 TaxID=3002440 RepID=UPI002DBD8AE4|nr:hypothetical protein [Flavobacterium sp. SUN046]MEC4048466.1 hypothetical protein [Flavobacterium sp. SUN046]
MIIELTKENLQKFGFNNEAIERLIKWDNPKNETLFINETCYFASVDDNKIYTEIDGFRKYYLENGTISFPIDCPDLIDEYFNLLLNKYLITQKELLKTKFVEEDQKEDLIKKQIIAVKKEIKICKENISKFPYLDIYYKKESIYKVYLKILKNKLIEQPQQSEIIKVLEVKKELYNHIFKNNAFEVWQSMFDEFGINESSRTDVKFIFEEMRKDGFIHNTVNQNNFLDWISTTYNSLIIQKTSNHSRTKVRLQAYSRAKELYKK